MDAVFSDDLLTDGITIQEQVCEASHLTDEMLSAAKAPPSPATTHSQESLSRVAAGREKILKGVQTGKT